VRVCILLGVLIVVMSTTALVGVFTLTSHYEHNVRRANVLRDVPTPSQQQAEIGPMNFLLLGSDNNSADAATQSSPIGERSDTIMIIHVRQDRKQASIISIPRDSYVDVPSAGARWRGGKNKINAAFAFGGPALTAKTVYALTKVSLNGAFVLDFKSTRDLVDAIGGVTVCVPEDVRSSFTSKVWTKGCHEMDGADALEFMRQRKNLARGDFDRIRDQQLVFRALLEKVSSSGVLTNPLKLNRLLSTVSRSITVDQRVNIKDLIFELKGIRSNDLRFATVPASTASLRTPAGSAVVLDPVKSSALFAAIRNDTIDAWLAENPSR
jgi:LCP family protein required for cell wall assembly